MKSKSKLGFTLVELLAVVAIISALAGIVAISVSNSTQAAQAAAVKRQEQMINGAYQAYLAAGGTRLGDREAALGALISPEPILGSSLRGPFLLNRPPAAMKLGTSLLGLELTGSKFAYSGTFTGSSGSGTGAGANTGGEDSGTGSNPEPGEEGDNEPPYDAFSAALSSITNALNAKATLFTSSQELWDSQVQAISSAYNLMATELGDVSTMYGPSGSFNVQVRAADPYYQQVKSALERAYQDYLIEWERALAHPPIPSGGKGTGSLSLGSAEALRNSGLLAKLKNPYTGMAPTVTTDPVASYLLSQIAPAGTELAQFRRFIDALTAE